jgi:hypothetical protein
MNDNTLVFDRKGIATGNMQEDYKSRKKFITDFMRNGLPQILHYSNRKRLKNPRGIA